MPTDKIYIQPVTDLVDALTSLQTEITTLLQMNRPNTEKDNARIRAIDDLIEKKEHIWEQLSPFSDILYQQNHEQYETYISSVEQLKKNINNLTAQLVEKRAENIQKMKEVQELGIKPSKIIEVVNAKEEKKESKKSNKVKTKRAQRDAARRKAATTRQLAVRGKLAKNQVNKLRTEKEAEEAARFTVSIQEAKKSIQSKNESDKEKVALLTENIQKIIDSIPSKTKSDIENFNTLLANFKTNLTKVLRHSEVTLDLLNQKNATFIQTSNSKTRSDNEDITSFNKIFTDLKQAMERKLNSLGAHTLSYISKKINEKPTSKFFQNLSDKLAGSFPEGYAHPVEELSISELSTFADASRTSDPKEPEAITQDDEDDTSNIYVAMQIAIKSASQNTGHFRTTEDKKEKMAILNEIAQNLMYSSDKKSRLKNLELFIEIAGTHRGHRTQTKPSLFSLPKGDTATLTTFKKYIEAVLSRIKDDSLKSSLESKLGLSSPNEPRHSSH